MANEIDLSSVSLDDLLAELRKRPGIVSSVWNIEDAHSAMEADTDYEALTDEQAASAAAIFLAEAERGLQDALGNRGNEYLADRWESEKDSILAEVKQEPEAKAP